MEMREVTATVVYKGGTVYHLTVHCKADMVNLTMAHREYNSFQDMYQAVVDTLINNGFYAAHWVQFGFRWYNILFVNLDNPEKTGIYPIYREVTQ